VFLGEYYRLNPGRFLEEKMAIDTNSTRIESNFKNLFNDDPLLALDAAYRLVANFGPRVYLGSQKDLCDFQDKIWHYLENLAKQQEINKFARRYNRFFVAIEDLTEDFVEANQVDKWFRLQDVYPEVDDAQIIAIKGKRLEQFSFPVKKEQWQCFRRIVQSERYDLCNIL